MIIRTSWKLSWNDIMEMPSNRLQFGVKQTAVTRAILLGYNYKSLNITKATNHYNHIDHSKENVNNFETVLLNSGWTLVNNCHDTTALISLTLFRLSFLLTVKFFPSNHKKM